SPGSPASSPVDASKLAQAGAFSTLQISVSPSRSDAVGMNAYSVPAATVAGGSPDVDGGVAAAAGRPTTPTRRRVVVDRPSVAAGMNACSVPAATVAGGSPDSDGGVFTVASRTTISNGGSVVVAGPSVAAITTSR